MLPIVALVVIFCLVFVLPAIVGSFLRSVQAGTIRMVTRLGGSTAIYRGPGKSLEVPLLTTGTTLSSKAINVDLDITDQTADLDENGSPKPIKVRVLASAIVSVGDTDSLIKTAANRYFSKPEAEQMSTIGDLLSSAGRRAVNLLTHDQLFSAKTTPTRSPAQLAQANPQAQQLAEPSIPGATQALQAAEDDDDPLAIIIRKACSRELTDLGLIFNSLNIKVVQSEVADARRRQSAAEAQANADIVAALQSRRAKEAQLEAERVISDKQRELEQTRASNAAIVAQAEALKQDALAIQREAELRATQIAQATADAERLKIEVGAQAEAEAIRITRIAHANAESIQKVNEAIKAGGESYFRYRQIEMLPEIAPAIADALAQARLITISSGNDAGGAADAATNNITSVIQTVLAAQLVSRTGLMDSNDNNNSGDSEPYRNGSAQQSYSTPPPVAPPPAPRPIAPPPPPVKR